jgi:hypothetical protein
LSLNLGREQCSRRRSDPNCEFEFDKRGQLFIRVHNETLSIVVMRVGNKDRSPVPIDGCDTAPTPTGPVPSETFHARARVAALGSR